MALFGNTTVVDGSAVPDPRTGALPILRQSTGLVRRERLDNDIDLPTLARVLQNLQTTVHDMIAAIRRMPESGSRTIIRDVTFSSGVAKTLPHLLAVRRANTNTSQLGAGASGAASIVAASPGQIRFEVFNQRVAAGACYRSAIDERTITLVPNATFIADVRLFVVP